MTLAKARRGGHSQLAVWIPTELKNQVAAAAGTDGIDQHDVVADALALYFEARAKKASAPAPLAVAR